MWPKITVPCDTSDAARYCTNRLQRTKKMGKYVSLSRRQGTICVAAFQTPLWTALPINAAANDNAGQAHAVDRTYTGNAACWYTMAVQFSAARRAKPSGCPPCRPYREPQSRGLRSGDAPDTRRGHLRALMEGQGCDSPYRYVPAQHKESSTNAVIGNQSTDTRRGMLAYTYIYMNKVATASADK